MKTLDYVPGINHSFAQRLINDKNQWVIVGAHNIFTQQDPDEYAFAINDNYSFDDLLKLDPETPIYAGVNSFEPIEGNPDQSINNDFETVQDLIDSAKDVIRNVYQNLNDDERPHFRDQNMFSMDALIHVAANIWNLADWASLETVAIDIEDDINECLANGEYEAYPELLK